MSPCTQCVNQRSQGPRTVLTQLLWDWKTRWGVYSGGFIVSRLTCVFNISACYTGPKQKAGKAGRIRKQRAALVTPVRICRSVNFTTQAGGFVSRAWTNRTGDQSIDKKTKNKNKMLKISKRLEVIVWEWKREGDKREPESPAAAWSCCPVVSPFAVVWVLPYKEPVRASQLPAHRLTRTTLRDLHK